MIIGLPDYATPIEQGMLCLRSLLYVVFTGAPSPLDAGAFEVT
jgi:hypothetical protein